MTVQAGSPKDLIWSDLHALWTYDNRLFQGAFEYTFCASNVHFNGFTL